MRSEDLPALAAAGVWLVGENRAQDLAAKVADHGDLCQWDFIGALQSRRVRAIVPHVRLIHSVASVSALRELDRHRNLAKPGLEILIEINVAREPGKSGIAPDQLDSYLERAPVPVAGLMCMPRSPPIPRTIAAGSPRCASWRPSAASSACRWAPPRTSPSPCRRGPQ